MNCYHHDELEGTNKNNPKHRLDKVNSCHYADHYQIRVTLANEVLRVVHYGEITREISKDGWK